jgi:hypothetical protein
MFDSVTPINKRVFKNWTSISDFFGPRLNVARTFNLSCPHVPKDLGENLFKTNNPPSRSAIRINKRPKTFK